MKLAEYHRGTKRAFFVAVEGPDGLGKTTQVARLATALKHRGYDTAAQVAPAAGYAYYGQIRALLADGAMKNPLFLQALMVANRVDWQARALLPMLYEQRFIVMDRWNASGHVYGLASGLADDVIETLMSDIYDADLTIILTGRPHRQEGRDEYERDPAFQTAVAKGYEEWAAKRPGEAISIDGDRPPPEVTRDIVAAVLLAAGMVSKNEIE